MKIRALFIGGLFLFFGRLLFPFLMGEQSAPPSGQVSIPSKPYEENEEIPEAIRAETFKLVWETVRDQYYDPTFGGQDWNAIGAKYRPLAVQANKSGEFHALLGKMLGELGRSHLAVFAPHQKFAGAKPAPETRMFPDGLAFCAAEGQIAVASIVQNSPAWGAGLRSGSVLVKAGGLPLPTPDEVRKQTMRALVAARRALAGPGEKPVDIVFLGENGRELTASLPRSVPYREAANLGKSVFEHRRIHPRIGYIRFDGWAFDLKAKLEAAVKDLWDSDALIVDCRQNRGGVNPGVDYLSMRLCAEPGLLAVETSREGVKREWKHEGSGESAYKGLVAILVDDGSGSASEVFAGAMQEKGRAIILGHTSYGGVLNSTQAPLPTGGLLQYPHSDLRTPKGKSLEGVGVIPDIPVELTLADLARGKDTVIERAIAELLARRPAQI